MFTLRYPAELSWGWWGAEGLSLRRKETEAVERGGKHVEGTDRLCWFGAWRGLLDIDETLSIGSHDVSFLDAPLVRDGPIQHLDRY